ncbi:hypothetical protein DER46DRAFT_68429 [Fusarium sp. MPI-SDFR-AT-0072]|uniref:Uncharacterized protein n=1 Tax=Fusarium oxysporum f. sp. rapae TaxID=485398 RepID=A0A8J5PE21_FUSOX|nr:hypothetical protein Forpe1208_v001698 [Fusarium oxysporum f. sp. rapae]KAH7181924.1 hypothetical protein DER46DRAFT_68429 [Fusarium sp. MPI-SDFR-AT-0072]
MSSPSKDEAGLNTPPKNNRIDNIAPNIEALFEADQKVEAPKALGQGNTVPDRVTLPYRGRLKRHGSTQASQASPQPKRPRRLQLLVTAAALREAHKEIEALVEQEVRIVQGIWDEGEWDHLEKSSKAKDFCDPKREDGKKHMNLPHETKTQEPTVGASEDVEEKNQTDDAVPPETDDILDLNIINSPYGALNSS